MDPFFQMVIIIVFIACTSHVVGEAIKAGVAKRDSVPDRVEAELAALRKEIAALRNLAHDLILSFDSTVHQQEERLQSLERHVLAGGRVPPAVLSLQEGSESRVERGFGRVRRRL